MVSKFFILILLFCSTSLYAHKIPGISLNVKKIENNKIEIKAFFNRSKRALKGNEVRLISMFDNRVLAKKKIVKSSLTFDIPNESYWVYLIVRDNDIVVDGIAPEGGFLKTMKKEKIAFLYNLLFIVFSLGLALFIAYKKTKTFKQNLS